VPWHIKAFSRPSFESTIKSRVKFQTPKANALESRAPGGITPAGIALKVGPAMAEF
jgi:hypothetical protein